MNYCTCVKCWCTQRCDGICKFCRRGIHIDQLPVIIVKVGKKKLERNCEYANW